MFLLDVKVLTLRRLWLCYVRMENSVYIVIELQEGRHHCHHHLSCVAGEGHRIAPPRWSQWIAVLCRFISDCVVMGDHNLSDHLIRGRPGLPTCAKLSEKVVKVSVSSHLQVSGVWILNNCTCTIVLLLHPFDGLFFRTTWVSLYQKGKTSLDLNEAWDGGVSGISWTCCWLQEAQAYADDNGLLFMETSAKTASNVNEIFMAIGLFLSWKLLCQNLSQLMLCLQRNDKLYVGYHDML